MTLRSSGRPRAPRAATHRDLRRAVRASGVSGRVLANILGLSTDRANQLVNDHNPITSTVQRHLERIAEAVGYDGDLFEGVSNG